MLLKRLQKAKSVNKEQAKKLMEMGKMISEREKSDEERERAVELERNKVEQMKIQVQESLICRHQFIGGASSQPQLLPGMTAEECSKQLWVLQKHQPNLVQVTRKNIDQIITATAKAGIVSNNIGKCGKMCTIPDHDCTSAFYEALLVRVGESPRVLEEFLHLMQQDVKLDEACKKIFTHILRDIS